MNARNIAKTQGWLIENYGVEIAEDWMLDTSEDFVAKHGRKLEAEIESRLPESEELDNRYFWITGQEN